MKFFRLLLIVAAVAILTAILTGFFTTKAKAEGFYVNPFVGAMVLDSTVTVGDTKLVDQGGDALMGGLRAGWGRRFSSGLYLGAEAEGFLASGRSRAVVNGVGYSYAVNDGVGAYARAGWMTQGGALFFARVGGLSLGTSQGRQNIPSAGVGAEVPFAPRWAARIDGGYSWNRVEHYTITAGIVYRF